MVAIDSPASGPVTWLASHCECNAPPRSSVADRAGRCRRSSRWSPTVVWPHLEQALSPMASANWTRMGVPPSSSYQLVRRGGWTWDRHERHRAQLRRPGHRTPVPGGSTISTIVDVRHAQKDRVVDDRDHVAMEHGGHDQLRIDAGIGEIECEACRIPAISRRSIRQSKDSGARAQLSRMMHAMTAIKATHHPSRSRGPSPCRRCLEFQEPSGVPSGGVTSSVG